MASGRRPRILVVEDDGPIRNLLVLSLLDEGFETTQAANGLEALDVVDQATPDLIVLDLAMPVMDGRTFYHRLRESGAREIPVIVVSAVGAKRAQRELGAEAAFDKPFDTDDIVAEVWRLVRA